MVSANEGANTLTVLTNNGTGGFGSDATLNVTGVYPKCIVAADVNGDGKVDLVSANSGNNVNPLTVFINATVFRGPLLSIVSGGSLVDLFWPASATNYALESTLDLSSGNWRLVTNGTPIPGGVGLTNSSPARFFRLHSF